MTMTRRSILIFSALAAGLVLQPASGEAAVGHPATPVSYAGVARRSTVAAPVATAAVVAPVATAAVLTPGVGVGAAAVAVATPGVGAPGVGVVPGPGVAPVNAGGPVNRVGVR